MATWITGDTHGDLSEFKARMNQAGVSTNETVINTGDFGFAWGDAEHEEALDELATTEKTIAFIDGNHENFDKLDSYPTVTFCGGDAHQIRRNIYHLIRGNSYQIGKYSFFCFGGAYSIDKAFRQEHISWWPQEIPCAEDYANANKTLKRIGFKTDVVLTHTVPTSIIHRMGKIPDPHDAELTGFLQWLYREVDWTMWFAGHWHINKSFDNLTILYDDMIKLPD